MKNRGIVQRIATLTIAASLARCGRQVSPPPPAAVRLVAYGSLVCAVDARDDVWCWGMVHDGATYGARAPTHIGRLAAITALVSDDGAVCARTADGRVHCAGANERAQLGGGADDRAGFAPVLAVRDAVELVRAAQRWCARTQGGELWCWGTQREQLGLDAHTSRRWEPTRVPLEAPIRRVHGGDALCVEFDDRAPQCEEGVAAAGAISAPWVTQSVDGALVRLGGRSCGLRSGTLRCGSQVFSSLPADFAPVDLFDDTLCGTTDGQLRCLGERVPETYPTMGPPDGDGWRIATLPRFTERSSSALGGCVVGRDRRAYCWGDNNTYSLGRGLLPHAHEAFEVLLDYRPRAVRGRYLDNYPAVVRLDSVVNDVALDERLYRSTSPHVRVAVRDFEPSMIGIAVGLSGVCVYGGRTRCGLGTSQVTTPFGDNRLETLFVASGDDGFARIAADRTVYWARADGNPPRRLPFTDARSVIVGRGYLCALDRNDVLSCVGADYPGTLDDPPTRAPEVIATDVVSLLHAPLVSCFIDRSGAVWCWGPDARWLWEPEVRGPIASPRRVPLPVRARDFAASNGTMCLVGEDRGVLCAGRNDVGQAGRAPTRRPSPWTTIEGVRDVDSLHLSEQQACAHAAPFSRARCWGATMGGGERYGRVVRQRVALPVALPERFEP